MDVEVTADKLQLAGVSATSHTTNKWAVNLSHIIAQLPGHNVLQPGQVPHLAPPCCHHCYQFLWNLSSPKYRQWLLCATFWES